MTQGQKVAQGQISAREKAHETAEVEEGLVEEAQGLAKPLKRTWSREHQLVHYAPVPLPQMKWRTMPETG
jgi:hypothetical protein